jgi:hypothetical protein
MENVTVGPDSITQFTCDPRQAGRPPARAVREKIVGAPERGRDGSFRPTVAEETV